MPITDPFQPSWLLRGAFIQTLLASARLRNFGQNEMQTAAKQRLLYCKDGIRLQGAISAPVGVQSKAVVIILHGWEGSMDSTYVAKTGNYLYHHGYTIFRINLRDHGPSHHLNEGLFFGTLLDEVFEAVALAASEAQDSSVFLIGFSLGGNFALRIARQLRHHPIYNLRHIVAISPVLDPDKATECIDNNSFLRFYFLHKWIRSLKLKQSLFTERYDFSKVINLGNVRAITEALLPRHTQYRSASEYFSGYTLTRADLQDIFISTTIITAEDDPIIPVSDFMHLDPNPHIRLVIHPYGGHNGFIETILLTCWYERKLKELFDRMITP